MNHSVAIGLIGHARAGKTTLARAIGVRLPHARHVSFSTAIRAEATRRGVDSADRNTLIAIGQRWVDQDPMGLVRATIAEHLGCPVLVIDGVRHVEVADALRTLLHPRPLHLAYLDAPWALLIERLVADGATRETAERLLGGPTEIQVEGPLRTLATLHLDARQPADELADQVVRAALM